MKMDDLVPHALGFCPQARRRYRGAGPLLFDRDATASDLARYHVLLQALASLTRYIRCRYVRQRCSVLGQRWRPRLVILSRRRSGT